MSAQGAAERGDPAGAPRGAVGTPGVTQAYIAAGIMRRGEGIRHTGPAAAAVLAAGICAVALGATAPLALAVPWFDQALVEASGFFLPGGEHLGRFGGQQLVALVAWLGGWALLHLRWRTRQVSLTFTALALVVGLVVGTLLAWPPITVALAGLARHL